MSTDTITTTTVKINKTKIISKTIDGIACINLVFLTPQIKKHYSKIYLKLNSLFTNFYLFDHA